MSLDKTDALRFGVRLVAVWLAALVFTWLFGAAIIELALPLVNTVLNWLATDYNPVVSIEIVEGNDMLAVGAKLLTESLVVSAGTSLSHTLLPIVIFVALTCSWPTSSPGELVTKVVLSLLGATLILMLTAPFLLAGHVENLLQNVATQNGFTRPRPVLLTWVMLMETGGRWLLPILLSVIVVRFAQVTQAFANRNPKAA